MLRRTLTSALVALALVACSQDKGPKKTGPAVATGNGITITADEFKARLEEQSPFIRARYSTLERKKEFLDNLVRFEVLAKEAERLGLDKDPDVQNTIRKVMVQKLVQKNFADQSGAKDLPEPELQKYYDDHKDEFQKPKKVRLAAIVFNAPAGSPDRAKKVAAAKKALAQVKAAEKTNTLAFATAVTQLSEDPASKAVSGDLNFKSKEELEKGYGKELAEVAFALKGGELAPAVVETAQGVYVVKATGVQEEVNRSFDSVKAQIASKVFREKRTKEFDDLVKKLKADAKVTVNDAELEKIAVAAPPAGQGMPGMPGMPGMTPGMPGAAPGAMPARPMPPPPAAPATK